MNISIHFEKLEVSKKIVEKFKSEIDPQIVVWYFGPYGLKDQCVNYYKKNLFSPINQIQKNAKFWLYDLEAWGACRKGESIDEVIKKSSKYVDEINKLNLKHVTAFKSSKFFNWLIKEKNQNINNYIKEVIFKRDEIFAESEKLGNISQTKMGQIFQNKNSCLENLYDKEYERSYSALQYLEGIYITVKIIEKKLKEEKNNSEKTNDQMNIFFLLPNDENKYYCSATDFFKTDIEKILSYKYGGKLQKNVNIIFRLFQQGYKTDRIYLCGKTMKDYKFTKEMFGIL